jgi:adenylate kinase family enzyme
MDGNYSGTLDLRLAACDSVIFLDFPRLVCLWRVIRRRIRFRGRSRPDMAHGCPEHLTWEFIRWIWNYPTERRPRILARLSALGNDRRVIVLSSVSEIENFFQELRGN